MKDKPSFIAHELLLDYYLKQGFREEYLLSKYSVFTTEELLNEYKKLQDEGLLPDLKRITEG